MPIVPITLQLPIVPYPGEKFCPVPQIKCSTDRSGVICSMPTFGVKFGIRVCQHHFDGSRPTVIRLIDGKPTAIHRSNPLAD